MKPYKLEWQMCDDFIKNNTEYWDIYPECYGFDIYMFSKLDDIQIGVQAKLKSNLQVIYQTLNCREHYFNGKLKKTGPHYTAILVPGIDSMYRTLCKKIGIMVLTPNIKLIAPFTSFYGENSIRKLYEAYQLQPHNERYTKPELKLQSKAGVPCPRNMSKWRINSIKHFVEYEKKGYTTSSELKSFGLQPTENFWKYCYKEPKVERCFKLVLRNPERTPITGYEKEYQEYKNNLNNC